MRMGLKRSMVVLGALAMATMGLAAPANAAASDCPAGYVCLWATTNFTGSRWQGANDNATLPSWISGKSDTLYSHGNNCDALMFTGANYTGDAWQFARGYTYVLANYGAANLFKSQSWTNCNSLAKTVTESSVTPTRVISGS